ncbi:MAG: hypothetical protein ACREOG_07350 [Gemmatimonadaceae bacterium]
MLRRILAIAAGIVVFIAIVSIFDGLGSLLFPTPPGFDPNNPDAIRERMANTPAGALAIVLLGSTLAALAGSYVTSMLIGVGGMLWGFVTGGLGLLATLVNALTVPHPAWFVIAALVGVIGATVLGVWLSGRRKPARVSRTTAPPRPAA